MFRDVWGMLMSVDWAVHDASFSDYQVCVFYMYCILILIDNIYLCIAYLW